MDKLNFKSLSDSSIQLGDEDLAIRVSFDRDARTLTVSDNGIGMTAEDLENNIQLGDEDLAIRVSFDRDARTLTVSDNGIGMTAEDLENNLGTIAHSGSQEFKQANAEHQGSDVDIIGQFGVGFYSAFMVASRVRVVSRAFGEDVAHVWESDGLEGYTIEEGERSEHGTDVILTIRENIEGENGEPGENYDTFLSEWGLKDLIKRYSNYVRYPVQMMVTKTIRENIEGENGEPGENYDTFLSEWGLKDLIKRYSNYVRYPVQMMVTKSREKERPEDAGDDYTPGENGEPGENYDTFLSEWGLKDLIKRYSNYVRYPVQMMVTKSREKERPEDAGDDYTPDYEDYEELDTINSMTPIWKKRSSDVSDEDYNEFYKSTFLDFEDPARCPTRTTTSSISRPSSTSRTRPVQ